MSSTTKTRKTSDEQTATGKPGFDPIVLAESLASAADKSAKLLGDFLARKAQSGSPPPADEFGVAKAFLELSAKMLANSNT